MFAFRSAPRGVCFWCQTVLHQDLPRLHPLVQEANWGSNKVFIQMWIALNFSIKSGIYKFMSLICSSRSSELEMKRLCAFQSIRNNSEPPPPKNHFYLDPRGRWPCSRPVICFLVAVSCAEFRKSYFQQYRSYFLNFLNKISSFPSFFLYFWCFRGQNKCEASLQTISTAAGGVRSSTEAESHISGKSAPKKIGLLSENGLDSVFNLRFTQGTFLCWYLRYVSTV